MPTLIAVALSEQLHEGLHRQERNEAEGDVPEGPLPWEYTDYRMNYVVTPNGVYGPFSPLHSNEETLKL